MWLPPSYWLFAAASGANAARSLRGVTAAACGQTTKVVRCEACGRSYAYELNRTGVGADPEGAYGLALQRAEANLQHLLAIGIEAVPCPACGWYQSDMIPQLRRRHRRWMLHVGQCLTVGLIPVAIFGSLSNAGEGNAAHVPWPIFVAGLVCLLAVGIGMFVWRHRLAKKFDPNAEDAEARKRCGQSRAALLSEQEANDVLADVREQEGHSMAVLVPVGLLADVREQERRRLENQPPPSPIGNQPQEASCLAGCLGLLVLIVIGIIWWNLWQASLKTKADKDFRRQFDPVDYRPQVFPTPLPPAPPLPPPPPLPPR